MSFLKKIKTSTNKPNLIYPTFTHTCSNVIFIDMNVKDAQVFANSVNTNTYPIMYSSTATKTELLNVLQKTFTKIDRIGVVFSSTSIHVPPFLDNSPFFIKGNNKELVTLPSENVDFMVSIIKEFNVSYIDYLACNTLQYTDWVTYYEMLKKETGVVVGASNDKTGNIKYGGDWMMESTMQDIEYIYFTKSISYYKYLLDSPWVTGVFNPTTLVIDGQNMYVSNYGNNTISKITLTENGDANIVDLNWVPDTGIINPFGLAVKGQYLYVTFAGTPVITQINLENGIINNNWLSLPTFNAFGITIYGAYMYVCCTYGDLILKIDVDSASIVNDWVTGPILEPFTLIINEPYIYTSNLQGTIFQILLETGEVVNPNWATGLINPFGLAIDGPYMYVSSFDNNIGTTVSQLLLENGSMVNLDWAGGLAGPLGLAIFGQYLYVANFGNGSISRISLTPPIIWASPQPPIQFSNTPKQFFPGQEPLYSNQGPNIRNMYKRAFNITHTVENTVRKQYIGRTSDAYGRLNRIKSINVGKYAFGRLSQPVSTKSYDPTYVRSALKSVRNN